MEFVGFERRDNVGIVTLNRPPINAFNKQMYLDLAEAFRQAVEDKEVRVVLLRAEGEKFFSAGNDVNDFADQNNNASDYIPAVNAGIWGVLNCPKPVVCACSGTASGAGFSIVVGSDIVLAVESARFSLPEIKVGVIGGGPGASYSLPRSIVKYMVLTGNSLTAGEMHRIGFIHEVTAPDELFDKAFALASQISKYPPIALRYAKESLKNTFHLEEILTVHAANDRVRTAEHTKHPDFREAAMAFLEKREPRYTGE